jgi:hypothetical protein
MASRLGYQAVLAEILEAGTNVDQAMDEGFPVAARTRRAVRSCSGAECTSRSRGRDGQGVRGRWKHGAEKGYIDILVELLEAGADVDRAKTDGVTPLYLVALIGRRGIVTTRLDAGVDTQKARNDDMTPLDATKQNGQKAVVTAHFYFMLFYFIYLMTGLPTTISRCLVDDGCRQQQCSAGGVSRSSGRYTQVKLRRVLRDAADYIGSCTYVNTSLICTTTSLRHEIKPLIRYLSPD